MSGQHKFKTIDVCFFDSKICLLLDLNSGVEIFTSIVDNLDGIELQIQSEIKQ